MFTSSRWLTLVAILSAFGCAETAAPLASVPEFPPGLASLSPEDRELVAKQKNCPVTGELLGSKDEPLKITVGDRAFFVCCPGCYGQVLKDPQKYTVALDTPAIVPTLEASAKP